MSKINARSPFYLSYSTPAAPSPEFTCAIANATDFEVDQEGIISSPRLSFGTIKSFTSSDPFKVGPPEQLGVAPLVTFAGCDAVNEQSIVAADEYNKFYTYAYLFKCRRCK